MKEEQVSEKTAVISRDELDILNFLAIVVGRKCYFFTIFMAFLLTGIGVAFTGSTQYKYTTKIEIGSVTYIDQKSAVFNRKMLVEPRSMLSKITNIYIPQVLSNDTNIASSVEVTARLLRGDAVISMTSHGVAEDAKNVKELHKRILSLVFREHSSLIDAVRRVYDNELSIISNVAKMHDADLKDMEKFIVSRQNRLDDISLYWERHLQKLDDGLSIGEVGRINERLFELVDQKEQLRVDLLSNKRKQLLNDEILKNKIKVSSTLGLNGGLVFESIGERYFQDTKAVKIANATERFNHRKIRVIMLMGSLGFIFGVLGCLIVNFNYTWQMRKQK